MPSEHHSRLTTRVAQFIEIDLPAADFVYAGLSLPFCDPGDFDVVWRRIESAIRPGGLFAGHLFGPNDSWYGTPDMTFHTRARVDELCDGFVDVIVTEQDEDGHSTAGPKHWNVFSVIARKPASRSG